ncbi:hypothetical protein Tco_0588132 [Tanacetum coccineum]
MYRVVTTKESQTNEAKSGLSSTGMNAASSVKRPMNRDSHVKNSVLANSQNSAKKVAVYVRKNKQTDNSSANVISNKENVNDVNVVNAVKEKTLLCVSYTTYMVLKTRFSEKLTQSKSLDTTSVVSKAKIDIGSASKAKHKAAPSRPNISPDPLDNLSKYLLASLAISPSHDDPYMQAYNAAANEPPIPPQAPIDPPPVLPPSPVLPLSPMFDSRDFFPPEEIPPPKDTETPVESPIPISPSSSVGSSSPVRSTTPPPDYPFDESIFAELDNSLWIIPRPLGSEPVPEESNEMAPKRTSTSATSTMTQAAIRKLVADSIATTLEEVANIAQRLMD